MSKGKVAVITAVVVVVAAAVAVAIIVTRPKTPSMTAAQFAARFVADRKANNLSAATKLTDDYVAQRISAADKDQAWLQLGDFDFDSKQYQAAIGAFQNVQGPLASQSYGRLAKTYEAVGNKIQAKAYYQKVLDSLDKKDPFYPANLRWYQQKIKELSA